MVQRTDVFRSLWRFCPALTEKVVVVAFFALMIARMAPAAGHVWSVLSVLLLLSEGLPAAFILIRRRAITISDRAGDWLAGLVATVAPTLVAASPGHALIPVTWCGFLMLTGLALQVSAKLFLGRSFGLVAANRGVRRGGPYRLVRHPIYAGYMLNQVGFLLSCFTSWNVMLYALVWILLVVRIHAEERILTRDPLYQAMKADVPWRLPKLSEKSFIKNFFIINQRFFMGRLLKQSRRFIVGCFFTG
ncbi:methyltransferase family protein [Acetobacter musti]|nr:isoprenylcysteine carboxylmethyltransferase family protein [Acetobacter musti]